MAWPQHQQQGPPQGPGMGYGGQFGAQRAPQVGTNAPPNAAFYDAGSSFISSGLGAYGAKIFGTSKDYVQSNASKYLSGHDAQYYFQVNDKYVKNKIRVILFPFLHRGHWTRITEQVAGALKYRPPIYDINAPDLYIPLMAFGTYVVLSGLALGLLGKFTPESLSMQLSKGFFGWAMQIVLIRFLLFTLGSGDAPILDTAAYGGYIFIGVSLSILARILWGFSYYPVMLWTSFCMATFLVKTMKRVLFAEARSYDKDSTRHHYLLLVMAAAQFPLSFWLGYSRIS